MRTTSDIKNCRVLISGAGPSGLAAALMLLERGWKDIVLVERRAAPDAFERGKAFNYQLDGRGQRILSQLGIGPNILREHGLPNDHFTQEFFFPDGSSKQVSFPALLPNRKTPYWMTRANVLDMLQTRLLERNTDGRVSVHYATSLKGLTKSADNSLHAQLITEGGEPWEVWPRLILACDGLNSAVKSQLRLLDPACSRDFDMTVHPSPSAELGYKVLSFPARIPICGDPNRAVDHTLAYWFFSNHKEPERKMALCALPVPHAQDPRNINIILHRSHSFWGLESADEILSYLKQGFPQLDFDALLPQQELEDFAAVATGYFPNPQYANRVHFSDNHHSDPRCQVDCLLLGDAAHAFPPDLGMGVNSALEDVFIVGEMLDRHDDNIHQACEAFESRRLPENRSLVRLVQTVHPYQYNQVPWRLKLWFLKFFCQNKLTKLSKGRIPPPGFVLSQKHLLNFVEMEQLKKSADRALYGSLFAVFALAVSAAALLLGR